MSAAPATPYTASAIRASNPPGTVVVYAIHAAGQPDMRSVFEFGDSDEEGVLLGGQVTDETGRLVEQTAAARVTWAELRDHALFPEEHTLREDARATTPGGSFDCWLYTVDDPEAGTLSRYWFAKERAGSPVLMTVERDGAEIYRMELEAIRSPR